MQKKASKGKLIVIQILFHWKSSPLPLEKTLMRVKTVSAVKYPNRTSTMIFVGQKMLLQDASEENLTLSRKY